MQAGGRAGNQGAMISQFLDAWGQPAMRHAMLIHLPIALSIVGLPLLVVAAVLKRHRGPILWTAIALYLAMAAAAYVTKLSGEDAKEAIEGSLAEPAEAVLEEHEELGDRVWLLAAAVAVIGGASLARPAAVRITASWLAVASGLFAAGWVANTADHGGRLVYEHGAGTPEDWTVMVAEPGAEDSSADPRLAFFRTTVRPILLENCIRCHRPSRAKRAGGLDQTSIENLLAGGRSGEPAVVPGRPEQSLMITAVSWTDPDLQMPPTDEQLPAEAIAALETWIAQGAVWEPIKITTPYEEDEGEHEGHEHGEETD